MTEPPNQHRVCAPAGAGAPNETRAGRLIGDKIDRIWKLEDGWRGPGSLAPSATAKRLYVDLIEDLSVESLPAAEPTPTADGGLHMEWRRGETEYSAEITTAGHLVLNVFAPDESDDIEVELDTPTPTDFRDFVQRGTLGSSTAA
ncbi:MAG TPA: hypothetical protein VIW24_22060 [Aldersonia sp.]